MLRDPFRRRTSTPGLEKCYLTCVCVCVCVCVCRRACACVCSVMPDSLQPHSPLGSSVHEILQARILECVAMCLVHGIKPMPLVSPALASRFLSPPYFPNLSLSSKVYTFSPSGKLPDFTLCHHFHRRNVHSTGLDSCARHFININSVPIITL